MIAAPQEPRKPIPWATIAQFVAIFSGAAAFVTFLATVPFSPARYWAWRLRKQTDTVKGLDPDRHKAQRDVLMRPVDDLANRAAAAQRIPTPWRRYIILVALPLSVFYLLIALLAFFIGVVHNTQSQFVFVALVFGTIVLLCIAVAVPYKIVRLLLYNKRERRRFIDEGCRAGFVVTPRPRPWIVRGWRWLQTKLSSVSVRGDHRDVHPGRVRGE
jgi:hypothetical protein